MGIFTHDDEKNHRAPEKRNFDKMADEDDHPHRDEDNFTKDLKFTQEEKNKHNESQKWNFDKMADEDDHEDPIFTDKWNFDKYADEDDVPRFRQVNMLEKIKTLDIQDPYDDESEDDDNKEDDEAMDDDDVPEDERELERDIAGRNIKRRPNFTIKRKGQIIRYNKNGGIERKFLR